jgi:hypothetical protein
MTAEKNDLITFRPFQESDINFILDSWLKTLRNNNDTFRLIDRDVYKTVYPEVVRSLVNNSHVMMCVLKEDDDVILGYAVYHGTKLHWVFVKDQWRGLGIMKDLVPQCIMQVSHYTKSFIPIMKKNQWSYNPFL